MRNILILFTVFGLLTGNVFAAKDKAAELDSIMNHWYGLVKFNGTVLVAQHGKILLHKGYGIRDVQRGDGVGTETLYEIGGLTSMFTASLVFKLHAEGKLSINDPISKYLTDYPGGDKISVRDLLAHTSGIKDYMKSDTFYSQGIFTPRSREEILSYFKGRPLDFEPGTKFQMSTSNYYLLGMIIEKVTDTTYFGAMHEQVLQPLGIENSAFSFGMYASWDKAQGYNILNQYRMVPAFPTDSTVSYAMAGLFTSTGGLYKFANAVLHDKYLPAKWWDTMATEVGPGYGHGFEIKDVYGHTAIGHTGEVPGFVNYFFMLPHDSTIVMLLSNDFESETLRIGDDLFAALYGKEYKLPKARQSVFLEQRRLESYVGRYEMEGGWDLEVTTHDRLLWGKVKGNDEFTLLADVKPDEFFLTSNDAEFYFIRDEKTNLVTGVVMRQNRREVKGRKWQ